MIYATFVEIFVLVSLTENKVPGPGYFISIFWAFFFSNSVAKYYHIKMTSN